MANNHFHAALRRGLPRDANFIAWPLADSVICSEGTQSCTASWNFGTNELLVDVQVAPSFRFLQRLGCSVQVCLACPEPHGAVSNPNEERHLRTTAGAAVFFCGLPFFFCRVPFAL